jgi:hypothetical protein
MATFVLIPGAGGDSWYWHRVVPELVARGHEVVAPDLPAADDAATFSDYADHVVAAVGGGRRDLVVVAQSLGAFTAPLVCDRIDVDLLVLTAAMVPEPGERAADWWDHTGAGTARRALAERQGRPVGDDVDVVEYFVHDVPEDVVADMLSRPQPDQSGAPMEQPVPFDTWPDVPTRFLLFRDDRFFPADFMRGMVQARLGVVPDEIDGGHLAALSRPTEVAERLHAYWTELAEDPASTST